LHILKIQKNWI